jgi:hypothetical protein
MARTIPTMVGAPASTSEGGRRARHKPQGLLLTPRALAVLTSVYQMRQLDREQIVRLHFRGLAEQPGVWTSTVPGRSLRKLVAHDFLVARPQPVTHPTGRPPLVYAAGPNAAPYLAQALQRSTTAVLTRIQQDMKLSWLFYAHRHAIADTRIALQLAAESQGYTLTWYADEEVGNLRESVKVGGKALPIRPDAFLALHGERQTACFLEVQLTSEPRAYLKKALAYEPYYRSGAYTQRFGFRSMRVLALTDTETRAANLHTAISSSTLALKEMFWATSLTAFCTAPLEASWFVGGESRRLTLLGA